MCLIGIAAELLWIASYGIGPFREHSGAFLGLMASLLGLCLWAFFRVPLEGKRRAVTVLFFALLFRLTVLPAPPHQSEDVYRYIWDARLSHHGISPYAYPPEAHELRHLRDSEVYPQLNSKPYLTAYPPLSQLLFTLSYELFGESVTAMKGLFGLLEFATVLLAWRMLLHWNWRLEPLYLLAWNPFFVLEFSHSGHSDSGAMFLTLLSIHLLGRSRRVGAALAHAGSVLIKLHPALWFPLYLRRAGLRAGLAALAAGTALSALYFTPAAAWQYIHSLRLYFRLFEFNAGIHYLLRWSGREFYGQAWDQLTGPYLAAALLGIAILLWWKFPLRDERDLLHAGFWLMTADLCLSTTVHPWYLSWAAVALPFFPYAFMVYWTGSSLLSYIAYSYRPVFEPGWVTVVEYVPMYALMAWEVRRGGPLLGWRGSSGNVQNT